MKNRLVDKAEVLETFADLYDIFDGHREIQKKLDDTYDNINDLPYIDAIPVEWITNYIYLLWWDEESPERTAIETMVKRWKKSNE